MDVTRPSPLGTTPLSRRQPLPDVSTLVSGNGSAPSGTAANHAVLASRALAVFAQPQILGAADGDFVLASGVRIRRRRIGTARVSDSELLQAMQGVQQLPLAHQQSLARSGVIINLVPVAQLELNSSRDPNMPVIGSTGTTTRLDGRIVPTDIRIVTKSPLSKPGNHNSIAEITQHEIGHVFAVLGNQDTSEAAAERYASTY